LSCRKTHKTGQGTEEWVAIKKLPGSTFPIIVSFFGADNLNSYKSRAKFVYLLDQMLISEGKTLDSYTREELSEKYNIGLTQLRLGRRELSK
jgi:hypothetical protein